MQKSVFVSLCELNGCTLSSFWRLQPFLQLTHNIYLTRVCVSFLSDQRSSRRRAAHPLRAHLGNLPASDGSVSGYEGMKSRKGVSWLSGAKQRRAGHVRVISWSIWQREVGLNPVGVNVCRIWDSWKLFFLFCGGDAVCSVELYVCLCTELKSLWVLKCFFWA